MGPCWETSKRYTAKVHSLAPSGSPKGPPREPKWDQKVTKNRKHESTNDVNKSHEKTSKKQPKRVPKTGHFVFLLSSKISMTLKCIESREPRFGLGETYVRVG